MSLMIRGLTAALGGSAILNGVDVAASAGQVTALVGPNGAGKSTLLKAVLQLVPSQGDIAFAGQDVRALSPIERARCVAYVPQRSLLVAALPVRLAVAAGRFSHADWMGQLRDIDHHAVEQALQEVDAQHLGERTYNTLSAGEQQRILVARALASEAPCILMDEPTASLDVGHALDLLALARRLATAGRTIVVVLHQLDDAYRSADRIVMLHRGRVLASGDPAAVLAAAPLAEAFGIAPLPTGALGFRRLGSSP